MVSPKVRLAQLQAARLKTDRVTSHVKQAALAIRLPRAASFRKKNNSTDQENGNEKAPEKRALLKIRIGRVRGKF
jgi:hypothetical protein